MKSFAIPQLHWYEKKDLMIEFPDNWDVDYCPPNGEKKKKLTEGEIGDIIRKPIGTSKIKDLAKNKKEVSIIFDDFTRLTPIDDIALHVIEELHAAGVKDSQIRFICALGSHGAHDFNMFRKKLGSDIVRDYPVYNHNCYENCTYVGDTPLGTPLKLNNEYLYTDLRIGIGGIAPHVHTGFGGGGKIILPGISHIDTIEHFHSKIQEMNSEYIGLGNYKGNLMNKDFSDAVKIAKLDFKIDALFNLRGEVCNLFAGDPVSEYIKGCEYAVDHYATKPSLNNDVAVVNAYGKANEMAISALLGMSSINFAKGIIVFAYNAPEGQITHYLLRSFGTKYGGRQYEYKENFIDTIKIIVMTEYLERTSTDWFVDPKAVTFTHTWDETFNIISETFPNGGKSVIIPDATMQYVKG